MRSIRHGVILGLVMAALAAPAATSPPPAPDKVEAYNRLLKAPDVAPVFREIQQDLVVALVAVDGYTTPAAVPSTQWGASHAALADRSDGALDLFDSGSHFALTTTDRGVDTSKRLRIALGGSGRIPLRI
jgi:hypothetical protein